MPSSIRPGIDVSIVMPCLNEAEAIRTCIRRARQALDRLRDSHGLAGEIVIADNGSSDGSQRIARSLGARVVSVPTRGYGAALSGGFAAAQGRYLVMGDADGSYDFAEAVPMVEALIAGADLCMGSRFRGGIMPGAMPWKNHYIGNPILTAILNLMFRTAVGDAHCGLRALTKACLDRLKLRGTGMEFASEMVIKAALLRERIFEVPVTLHRALRGRPPHLRPWRDGWRHLRYLLMLSPSWLFAVPAALGTTLALAILGIAGGAWLAGMPMANLFFGNYWTILAGSLLGVSHISGVLALACQLYGIREGYRRPGRWTATLARWMSLETMLIAGLIAMLAGLAVLVAVVGYWSAHSFMRIPMVLPAVVGTALCAIGMQNILGGFLLAVVGGNEARFLRASAQQYSARSEISPQPASVPASTASLP